MKILRLQADSFKRLKAVDITPKGNVVEITGRNAQGKTSVLDAIWAALGGATHIQAKPIRAGATKARIRLDLGELIVTRNITEKGSTLTVENAEGLPYKSPQRMLDDLVGALAFDPLAFTRMKAREQFDQLKAIAQVDLDLDTLDRQNQADFERRTAINREHKQILAQLEGMPVPAGAVTEDQDVSILLEQQQRLTAALTDSKLRMQAKATKQANLDRLHQEIEQIRAAFAAKKQAILDAEQELAGLEAPDETDLQDLSEQIQAVGEEIRNSQQANAARQEAKRQIERRQDYLTRAQDLEKQSNDLTETMAARAKAKQDAIAKAKMPVDGLGFGEGVVLYNGVPFDQASSAEQLRVSVAIAMAANPKLRVIRIQDGSLLDDTSMQVITDMARDHDMQVWMEKVDSTGKVGIVIEDGEVVAVNEAEAAPEQEAKNFPASHRGPESIGEAGTKLLDLE